MSSQPQELTRSHPEPVRVTNWPLKEERWTACFLIVAILSAAAFVLATTGSPIVAIFTLGAFAVSVWRLWLPVTFDFSHRGIVQTCWKRQRRIPWSHVARYEVLVHGVLLSADSERTVLSPLRSIYVRSDGQRSELVELLEYYLKVEE